ncbi:subtilisin-like protease Glyma18g48580 [Abrus precatorius]|uniref:Subtilisin-like protease Glyma18g48580 n=1 Tax=Abrus precatorius TaxID=3816 RepID=A0A8B8MII3_ABRPR|nr:subtilisin-like protease Glyma18g48580 [Abrus precatorius]
MSGKRKDALSKLIGARFFSKNYEAENGKLEALFRSARDFEGHGTHTLSTAGGNFAFGANVFGNGNGTAKGGSPRARVAAYKTCWSKNDVPQCHDADIIQAFDHAIHDAVDVISISAGKYPSAEALFTDGISIGAFHAVARNILVVCSADNDGPTPSSVANVAPWSFTVAAGTIDRDFLSNISVGNKHYLQGASLNRGLPSGNFYPLIHAIDARLPNATIQDARLCKARTLDPKKVRGKIVICVRREKITSIAEGQEAALAGAVGVAVVNDEKSGKTLLAEPHPLTAVNVDPRAASQAFNYQSSNKNNSRELAAHVTSAQTYLGVKPAPIMAGFSSRGPSAVQPLILKPDITGPGVNILAGYSPATGPSNIASDKRRVLFNIQQGTSMSCPHVAGVAALLKTLHPNWTPAAIKSAIMTTATTLDNTNRPIRDTFDKVATPFEYGSGHIRPNHAMDPGLVYDLSTSDYLIVLLSFNIENLNYPSITVAYGGIHTIKVTRTLTNVGPPSTYVVSTHKLEGFKVLVRPSSLTFKRIAEKKKFSVILKARGVPRHGFPIFGN